MVSIDDLPFFGQITEAEEVAHGVEAKMYRLSMTSSMPFPLWAKIMRVYWDDDESSRLRSLEQDASMNLALYNAAVSVPRPVGLFRLLSPIHPSPVLGFVRECIEGRSYNQLFPWQKEKAVSVFKEERQKAIEIGFIPRDCYPTKNCLYTVKGWSVKSVTLFDFSLWTVRE